MNINSVTLTGNLTKDPELKTFGETTVCKLRLAVNERVKLNGEWTNSSMYFDVDVFGRMAENCAQYLTRGSHIAVGGRLKWREWTTEDGGKRQAVSVVANEVEFPSKKEAEQAGSYRQPAPAAPPPQQDFSEQGDGDDDIPF